MIEKNEFEQTVQHEKSIVHKVTGKAARIAGGIQVRPANAQAAIEAARAGRKSEVSRETVNADAPAGDPERVVRREIIEERIVKTGVGVD